MNSEDLSRKLQVGDLQGLMEKIVRLWLVKHCPWASYAVLLVGNGVEDSIVPIRGEPSVAALPSQRLKLFQAE